MPLLQAVTGPLKGKSFPCSKTLRGGRDQSCNIVIPDEKISRHHFEIRRDRDGFVLYDLGSRNGTKVGGKDIKQHRLKEGDRFTVGDTEFLFEAHAAVPNPKAYLIGASVVCCLAGVGLVLFYILGPAERASSPATLMSKNDTKPGITLSEQKKAKTSVQAPIAKELDAAAITERYGRSVVAVTQGTETVGTGFVIKDSRHVITNVHVLEQAYLSIGVKDYANRLYDVEEVVYEDPKCDLAILRISQSDLLPLTFASGWEPKVGDSVVVIGNPLGFEGTVTTGTISAIRDRLVNPATQDVVFACRLMQLSAPVSPGSSGGPVFNSHGQVIGIVFAQVFPFLAQNLNFAVSADAIPSQYRF